MNAFMFITVDPRTMLNWIAIIFVALAVVRLAWEMRDRYVTGRSFSPDLTNTALILFAVTVGIVNTNIEGWISWVLLALQFGALVLLIQEVRQPIVRLFSPDKDPPSTS